MSLNVEGKPKTVTSVETVLNWQLEKALAQNALLMKIKNKMDMVSNTIF